MPKWHVLLALPKLLVSRSYPLCDTDETERKEMATKRDRLSRLRERMEGDKRGRWQRSTIVIDS